MHHKPLMMRAKSNGNSKFGSARRRNQVAAATAWMESSTSIFSEHLFEPSDFKACIFNNSTHGDRVHRIVSWNRDEMRAVAHYNVLALAYNSEAGLFERLDRPEVINAGNFRHR
jgi:hypothetical protein